MGWTQTFSDAFTDTQYTDLPTHNAAWAQVDLVGGNGTWRISTNGTSAGCTVASSARCYVTGGSAPGNDQACQFTINGSALQREEGLLVRFTDGDSGNFWGGTGYVGYIESDGKFYIHRLDGGGSHTQIGSGNYTPSSGDILRLEAVGSDLTPLVNGSILFPVVDATYTSGAVGMWSGLSLDDGSNMSVDNFVAEEWSAPAAGGAIVFNLQIG